MRESNTSTSDQNGSSTLLVSTEHYASSWLKDVNNKFYKKGQGCDKDMKKNKRYIHEEIIVIIRMNY